MTEFLRASFISSSSGTERQIQTNNKIDNNKFRKKFKKNSSQLNSSQIQKFRSFQDFLSIEDFNDDQNNQKPIQSAILESEDDIIVSKEKQSPPPTLKVDIQKKQRETDQMRTLSKSKSKSPKPKTQQPPNPLLILQFDLKLRVVKLPVFINDTAFTLTHKLLQELNVLSTPQIIQKTADIIQQTIEMYLTRLYEWINYNRLGKIDSALWKAQAYKNNRFLQDIEDEMQVDLLNENLLLVDKNYQIGTIKLYQSGSYVSDIPVFRNQDPQECVRNFLYSSGIHYDQEKFNRLVNEVIQIQLLNGEELDSTYTKDQIITNIKVSHDKIVRVNTNRNQNLDKVMIKLSINNKLTPKQTEMVKQQIQKSFYI